MDMIGLGGLLGLLGMWGKGKLTEKINEVQTNIEKNSEQVESRVKSIEKIAADANRKVQDLTSTSQQFATKGDAEKILDRLVIVEKSDAGKKVPALEKRLDELQRVLVDVLNVHTNFQQRIEKLERRDYSEVLNGLDEKISEITSSIKTFGVTFDALDERMQSFEETLKNVMEGVDIMDGNFKMTSGNLDELISRVATLEAQPAATPSDDEKFVEQFATLDGAQKDLTKKVNEFNAMVQEHHKALLQWRSNFVAIQNHFNATQANFEEMKKFLMSLQGRIDAQDKSLDEFKAQLAAQNSAETPSENFGVIEKSLDEVKADVQSKFDAQEKSLDEVKADVQNKFDAQEKSLDEVKADVQNKFDAQEKSLDEVKADVQNKFDAQEKSLDEVKADVQSKFDAQEKSLDEVKATVATHGGLIECVQKNISEFEKVFDTLKEKTYLTIENFHIEPTGRIFFTNRPDEVFKNLKVASNLSGITSFLESSSYGKKENFIRIVENYRQNLKKVSDKVRRKKFNEDALSEEVTEAFFNTLSKFFLATIPISIYRGARQETLDAFDDNTREEEFQFYSAFLDKVNQYLTACHVYTVSVSPQEPLTSSDIDRMSVTRKETTNANEDNIIDEVERLPYYMDYLTESGDVESFFSEGKMVVLKFDGGAQ